MNWRNSLFVCFAVLFLTGCNYDPLNVDASETKVDMNFVNMDSLLFQANDDQLLELHQRFKEEIPEIYEYQLGYCIGISDLNDTAFVNSMRSFLADPYIKRVEERISDQFKDLSTHRNEIYSGFQHLKFHLPKVEIPESVVFMNSFFASNAFSTERQIGIGLERYLGKETDVILELPGDSFYQWMKDGLDERYLTRDALCSWIMTHIVEDVSGNLVEQMIRWGKVIYLTEAAFPEKDKSILLRYSEDGMKWALDQERDIWDYLVREKLLFKIDERFKINMLNEGPFTVGLPEKGPDRLGQFIGWRMVRKYMEIKRVSVEELINTPYTAILAEYEID
jgi:hypothetical protein